jgi:signal transduction histidine kinase
MDIGYVMDRRQCPLFLEGTDRREVLQIARVADMPDSARDLREALVKDKVKSVLVVPLLIAGTMIGAIAIDAVREETSWSDEDIRLLKLVAEVLAQAIDRMRADEELNAAQARLIQSEKMATLGQITAGVAHEINSPVAVIRSSADVTSRAAERLRRAISNGAAISDELRDELTNCIEMIERNCETHAEASARIAGIVDSLRMFTRVDEAAYQESDLNRSIESVLTLLSGDWKQGVAIERRFGDIPRVRMYPSELNQVFMTLLRNANEAIEQQGTITVSTVAEGESVRIQVADTGKGISADALPQLFNVGFSTTGSRVRMRTGLSNAYAVIHKHGGELRVTSEVGVGTEFHITLPINGN